MPIMKASARIATRLNYLCPQFFPAPGFWSLQHLKSMSSDARESNKVYLDDFMLFSDYDFCY